jgi:hypothetical protein
VARYYFDVQNGKPPVRDDERAEFDWTCSAFVESGLVAIRPVFQTEPD